MGIDKRTAMYKTIADSGGNRYRFFCEASGAAICTTAPFHADSPEEELQLAWEKEGKDHFSQCPKCGRYVCDTMYNADVCECVDCAPWEDNPKFCRKCGAPISEKQTYCTQCGDRAFYGEVWC